MFLYVKIDLKKVVNNSLHKIGAAFKIIYFGLSPMINPITYIFIYICQIYKLKI